MRKLFISDIHGCYWPMLQLLECANYIPGTDQLVVGGDFIDRGPDSGKVVQYLRSLQHTYPDHVHVLHGNHEDMLVEFLMGASERWIHNGGYEAAQSFEREKMAQYAMEWAITRPILFEDDEYVYVHAGIVPGIPLDKQTADEAVWMPYSARGIRFADYPLEAIRKTTGGKKVVFGHTPKNYVFDDGIRICCDLGAGLKESNRKLALVDLTNDTVYQVRANPSQDGTYSKDVRTRKIARKKLVPNE